MKNHLLIIFSLCSFSAFSQSDLRGIWEAGEENTMIEIAEVDGQLLGKLKSTDNKNAEIGRLILKDLEKRGTTWTGQIYAAKRKKWFDVELTPTENILELEIDAGILSKSVEWKRHL